MNDTKTTFSPADLKRLYWHSRRGMLELDLILVPFAEQTLPHLAEEEIRLYRNLLSEEDQDLFMWLTRRADAPAELRRIVDLVLANRSQASL